MASVRSSFKAGKNLSKTFVRANSTASTPPTSPFAPRHFLSIADLSKQEFETLVRNAFIYKQAIKSESTPPSVKDSLAGKSVALTFSKLSTRTRVSSETAVAYLGGHPMFLGKNDIQLGVNETLYDTSRVISSMVHAWVARVGPHSDVAGIAKHSAVPVINGLSDDFHPLQAVANMLTIHEIFNTGASTSQKDLGVSGLKMAWVGDANNVLFDIAMACQKTGIDLAVATPPGFEIPDRMFEIIRSQGAEAGSSAKLTMTNVPEEAVKDANMIVTDTWVSMGQESEKAARIKQFEGFQVTSELAKRGGAAENWKFMHCLPRKPEEVSDEVFFNPQRSTVFQEAENRVWGMLSVLDGFVVNKGVIKPAAS